MFCSLAVLDPRVGHTMDVFSPLDSVEEFMEYDSVVVFLAVGPAYNAKFFVISH